MKVVIVALALVAIAAAVPVTEQKVAQVLRSTFDQTPQGSYLFGFESEDGIKRDEAGQLKEVRDEDNKPRSVITVEGSFSYPKEDGTFETIKYVADENGYRAQGPSIPVPVSRR